MNPSKPINEKLEKINRSHRKIANLLLIIFFNSILPYNLFANNNGPTAPEAASFEPVDAPDMVNLATGDLSYVLPILNVPSPEGGYPLALSYHAGIAMDQEASWVGLGWNLNPGALNRSINGFPDDWKDSRKTHMVYDIGGESTSNRLSISAGWGLGGKISTGLYTSWGENRAFGGETTYFSGYGGFASISAAGVSAGIDASSEGGVGMSLKTEGGLTIASVGASKGGNSSPVPVSYSSSGFSVGLTLGFTGAYGRIEYGKRKTRYWSHDKKPFTATGALYAGDVDEVISRSVLPYNQDFDSYEVINGHTEEGAELENNFSAIAYDNYSVSGQGISMSLSPLITEVGSIHSAQKTIQQRKGNDNNYVKSHLAETFNETLGGTNGINFYVNNEYSSYLSLSTSLTNLNPPNSLSSSENFLSTYNFEDNNLETSIHDEQGNSLSNYNYSNRRMVKGSFVEVFTNRQITSSSILGFNASEPVRSNYSPDGIGGFRVTTVDGKTYIYSLPVYQHEQFDRSSSLEHNIEEKFFEEHSLDSYATHWLLTAVIGSDYVDKNLNNKIDSGDYGYWVNFEYGKWSDGFTWRTPTSGYQSNETTQTYAWGSKEVYYLDKITTRTHTALFVKETRQDNLSSIVKIGNSKSDRKWYSQFVHGYNHNSYVVSKGTDGNYYLPGLYENYFFASPLDILYSTVRTDNSFYYRTEEQRSLRLKEILLLKNKDIPTTFSKVNGILPKPVGEMFFTERGRTEKNSTIVHDSGDKIVTGSDRSWKGEFFDQIIDEGDVGSGSSNLRQLASKVIRFQYDYSSFKGTTNSTSDGSGKLTLKKVWSSGKGGITVIPPYNFDYLYSSYNRNNMDDWGYTNNNPAAGSLSKITTPTGAILNLAYESDDYYEEAAIVKRVFDNGLKFNFYQYNGKLRFDVEKDLTSTPINVNFAEYFAINKPVVTDIWACLIHEYNDWGCKTRKGTIDIPLKSTNVVAVTSSKVTFETDLIYTANSNDGLNWLYSASPMGDDFSDHIMQDRKRGTCPILDGGCSSRTRVSFQYKILAEDSRKNRKGGGIRVKKIETSNSLGAVTSKNYFYNQKGFSESSSNSGYRSSGMTSYSPSGFKKHILYVNELPRPNVVYGNVKVLNNDGSYKLFDFKTLSKASGNSDNFSLGDVLNINVTGKNYSSYHGGHNRPSIVDVKKYEMVKNFEGIGQLQEVSTFNSFGHVTKNISYKYKTDNSNQGVIQESFKTLNEIINNDDNRTDFNLNVTSIKTKPTVVESVEISENGFSNTTLNEKYDFNSGKLVESISILADGTTLKTKLSPAYLHFNGMGSKVNNSLNKNMLSQKAAKLVHLKDGIFWKTMAAEITTWNNEWNYYNYLGQTSTPTNPVHKIWRKHKLYSWDGDITTTDGAFVNFVGDFDNFNWLVGANQSNSNWIASQTTSIYDNYSFPVEQIKINNQFTSSKMGDGESKVFSTSNSPYSAQYFSSAEDLISGTQYFSGQVYKSSNAFISPIFHTGQKSLKVNANIKAFAVKPSSGSYKASIWAYKGTGYNYANTKIKAGSVIYNPIQAETIIAGDWVQMNFLLNNVSSGQEVYVYNSLGQAIYDDFRLFPSTSSLVSYVYNDWDELSYVLGPNNMAVQYSYDAEGRLTEVFQEVPDEGGKIGGFKLSKQLKYNHKRTAEMDANGNGKIDEVETYEPLQLWISVNDPSAYSPTITANSSGGSGNFSYRWASGDSQSLLTYGNWTSLAQTSIINPCPDGVRYYKCQVRDNVTMLTLEKSSMVARSCDGGGGPITEPLEPIAQ